MYLTLPLRGLEKRQARDVRPAVRAEKHLNLNLGDALLFLPHDLVYRRIKLSAKLNTYVLSHRGQAKFSFQRSLERTLYTHSSHIMLL